MSEVRGKEIAALIINLNVNLVCWSRLHLEQIFSTNGKEEGKLTIQQFNILIYIRDFGINTVSEISKAFCLSKSSTSLTISKMVAKGYLIKEAPEEGDDGRKIYFHLTEKGHASLQETESTIMEVAGQHFDSFDAEKRKTLFNHLYMINHLLITGGTVNEGKTYTF
ncbi:MarR family winged helix-turn-helix transcriptional regulator [Anaerotignum sp. MB30-C6]|uniref:MarR family winged helix-turn-helix transcriptional regulator n=1 Tax=Anaerotignum sp. MB30-C6 TaxID=3070814 RepID=UPI0027DDD17B|nr:MarR family transcriptional regulator [Anaerotignum sp. MB30-C6]WMI81122.1 MarR family transcriptional regulator [Anaerotignum sp. MB30-C6]